MDIPNLRDALVPHPSQAADGTLYFHAGKTNYSLLEIDYARPLDGGFDDAGKLPGQVNRGPQVCTPFIDPALRFLLFEDSSGLRLSFRTPAGSWSPSEPLITASPVPSHGNPYLTPD